MGREEQVEEREVLDSIFPDEITGLTFLHQLIVLTLCPTTTDDDVVGRLLHVRVSNSAAHCAPIQISPRPSIEYQSP